MERFTLRPWNGVNTLELYDTIYLTSASPAPTLIPTSPYLTNAFTRPFLLLFSAHFDYVTT